MGDAPDKTLDNNLNTRWTSGIFQNGGEWFQMDMLEPQTFNRILLKQGTSGTADYPRGYELYLSDDETNWGEPLLTGTGTEGEATVIELPEAKTNRFIRLVQTGTSSNKWWSIHEFGIESDLPAATTNLPMKDKPAFYYKNGQIEIRDILAPFTVKIYNLSGQLIQSFADSQPVINLHLIQGIYLVTVENPEGIYRQKIGVN
jgi:hypothetical protein